MSSTPSAWGALRSLPRSVWWLAGASLVNRMGAMVFPFLVLYFHRHLGLPLELATMIAACYGVGSGFAAPLGGWLADRYDAVLVLAWSMISAGVLMAVFPWISGTIPLILGTFAVALLTDLSRPSTLTALARLGGSEQSRDAFNLNYLAVNLGMSVGPLAGGYLALLDYRFLFWGNSLSALLAGGVLLLSGTRSSHHGSVGQKADWNVGSTAFLAVFWIVVALWVFMTFFAATPVYVVEVLHRPESLVGWIWLVNTGVIVLTTVQLNHWTKGKPLSSLLACSALLFALGYTLFLFLPGLAGPIACMLALTVGEMMLFTNSSAYLQSVVPAHKMGRAMALNSMAVSIALAASTPAVGFFFSAHRPDLLWMVCAIAGLGAAYGFWRLPRLPFRTSH